MVVAVRGGGGEVGGDNTMASGEREENGEGDFPFIFISLRLPSSHSRLAPTPPFRVQLFRSVTILDAHAHTHTQMRFCLREAAVVSKSNSCRD